MILPFGELSLDDIAVVGGKNASLGILTRDLKQEGICVPPGFALTTAAYHAFIAENGLEPLIREAMEALKRDKSTLERTGSTIRQAILAASMPSAIREEIVSAYRKLSSYSGTSSLPVAVRSSATAEDLPGASFAGQLESFLNVRGAGDLVAACQRCFASLYTDRAIAYCEAKCLDHRQVAVAVGVQQMVRSDRGGAGVIFTLDTETGFRKVVSISAAWGLGETVVKGRVEPDRYVVFKPLLDKAGARPIIKRERGAKRIKLVYGRSPAQPTRLVHTTSRQRAAFVLDENEILQLARWAVAIERHYGQPMDVEWARDGESGGLFIVQARPETVQSASNRSVMRRYTLLQREDPLLTGAAVGGAIASGKAFVVDSPDRLADFPDGAILVVANTDPDWVPIMKRAVGIVTDHGGPTSHAAIVSRELGVPAVVGTARATQLLRSGREITLSCAEGERGHVYDGKLPFACDEVDVGRLPETRTALMVNVADPGAAFGWWQLPAKGVGLARMEFVIANLIRAHPMALLHPERLLPSERKLVKQLVRDYPDGAEYFVDTLARGLSCLAAPWYPYPAIVRLSDFKTNEYARLVGGAAFEPAEENPMIGFRGASRYYDDRYREGFALECRALKRLRETMGFENVVIMVPFCRTPEEADRVLDEMAANGLRRGQAGLELYMMCEVPANVVLAEEFASRFDGFSIGSNDLTQLLLGIDRDSEILQSAFDERNRAVTRSIADVIARAHKAGIKVGLCGQAPSNYADFAEFLVGNGINSISLNPDSFVKTVAVIKHAEAAR